MSTFTGTSGDDSIRGTAGADDFHLEQGGEDFVRGGKGADVFYMGATLDAGDQILGGAGRDILVLDGPYDLAFQARTMTGVEQITLAAGWHYSFTGFSDANAVNGFTVDASALGQEDALYFDASGLTTHAVTLIGGGGFDTLIGGALGDSLVGGFSPDSIRGGEGDDTIHGGSGPDTLGGGRGDDEIHFGPDTYSVDGGEGDDMLSADSTFYVHSQIDGGDGFDELVLLDGGRRSVLTGKNLVDVEQVTATGTVIVRDSLLSVGDSLSVRAGAAGLRFIASEETDGRFDMRGAQGDDALEGGAGRDKISGAEGDDQLFGGGGDDKLFGQDGHDSLAGGDGDDRIEGGGGQGGDTLQGGAGDDHLRSSGLVEGSILDGGDGDDHLTALHAGDVMIGGLGQDTMAGSLEQPDTFIFEKMVESRADAPDLIDNLRDDDRINLAQIDADITTSRDQAFHLVAAFSGQAGELVVSYDAALGQTSIAGDVDGDGEADLVIQASGDHSGFTNFSL